MMQVWIVKKVTVDPLTVQTAGDPDTNETSNNEVAVAVTVYVPPTFGDSADDVKEML